MKLVLASGSASRARLLTAAGVAFEVHPACVDETAVKDSLLADGADAAVVADALAELKATRVSVIHQDRLVLGADQVLNLDGALLSKCESIAEAAAMLRRLRDKQHTLLSAVVLARAGAPVWRHVARARLSMRAFSEAFLEEYLRGEGEAILSAVGCYHFEGRGAQLFDRIEGDYFSILGLPLLPLLAALRDQGVIAK